MRRVWSQVRVAHQNGLEPTHLKSSFPEEPGGIVVHRYLRYPQSKIDDRLHIVSTGPDSFRISRLPLPRTLLKMKKLRSKARRLASELRPEVWNSLRGRNVVLPLMNCYALSLYSPPSKGGVSHAAKDLAELRESLRREVDERRSANFCGRLLIWSQRSGLCISH